MFYYATNMMYTTDTATAVNSLVLYLPPPFLPSTLTSSFLPHWEDIWSPTRPGLCLPPLLPSLLPLPQPILSVPRLTHSDPLKCRGGDSSDPPSLFKGLMFAVRSPSNRRQIKLKYLKREVWWFRT